MGKRFEVGDIIYQPYYSKNCNRRYLIISPSQDGTKITKLETFGHADPKLNKEQECMCPLGDYTGDYELVKDAFLTEVYKTKGEVNG